MGMWLCAQSCNPKTNEPLLGRNHRAEKNGLDKFNFNNVFIKCILRLSNATITSSLNSTGPNLKVTHNQPIWADDKKNNI